MRLIDVDAFEKWAWRNPDIEVDGENYVSMYAASNFALDHEISPSSLVKRGRWLESDIPNEKYVCSVCGGACWYYDYNAEVTRSKYCPNCGTKMRED